MGAEVIQFPGLFGKEDPDWLADETLCVCGECDCPVWYSVLDDAGEFCIGIQCGNCGAFLAVDREKGLFKVPQVMKLTME